METRRCTYCNRLVSEDHFIDSEPLCYDCRRVRDKYRIGNNHELKAVCKAIAAKKPPIPQHLQTIYNNEVVSENVTCDLSSLVNNITNFKITDFVEQVGAEISLKDLHKLPQESILCIRRIVVKKDGTLEKLEIDFELVREILLRLAEKENIIPPKNPNAQANVQVNVDLEKELTAAFARVKEIKK